MTLDEFFAALEATPRNWALLVEGNSIRRRARGGQLQCPITALTGHGVLLWRAAARQLGMDAEDAKRIAQTADYPSWGPPGQDDLASLRRRLLVACGLEGA